MRCLVTGATGHVGSFLTRRLVREGWSVSVLVRPQSDLSRIADVLPALTILYGEMENLEPTVGSITEAAPRFVFHLAWSGVTKEHRNDSRQLTENIRGSLRLFEIAHAAGCKRWIGLGSQAEYGRHDVILSETSHTEPTTAYGVAKLALFMLMSKACEITETSLVWIRLLAAYGPMDDPRHLIPSAIRALIDRDILHTTPGEQRWDYLYVEDAVDAIYRLAITTAADGVFNLGSGKAHEVREIVSMIRDLIDPSAAVGFGDLAYGQDQIMLLQTDITKIQQVTGWSPEVDLAEGLRRTVVWHRDDRSGLHAGRVS
ncbi:MAG TPA: NAD(P)-dependent oxidoreductase [Thermoanaerobaculia bacterium]|nr:NAD(P)-dependent oxidoreductase [Thermoanaerobaculia bacterium]